MGSSFAWGVWSEVARFARPNWRQKFVRHENSFSSPMDRFSEHMEGAVGKGHPLLPHLNLSQPWLGRSEGTLPCGSGTAGVNSFMNIWVNGAMEIPSTRSDGTNWYTPIPPAGPVMML